MTALAAYRHVLRSARIAFQGDSRILSAARIEARSKFDTNRSLLLHSSESMRKIAEAEEIAKILRQNIVQGAPMEVTNDGKQKYQLRIHDEIERGDNDSIKIGTLPTAAGGSCCGGAA